MIFYGRMSIHEKAFWSWVRPSYLFFAGLGLNTESHSQLKLVIMEILHPFKNFGCS